MIKIIKKIIKKIYNNKSLIKYKFKKEILSKFNDKFNGLDEPFKWRKKKWKTIKKKKNNPNKKCKEKNRVKVEFLTEKFPQIHQHKKFP